MPCRLWSSMCNRCRRGIEGNLEILAFMRRILVKEMNMWTLYLENVLRYDSQYCYREQCIWDWLLQALRESTTLLGAYSAWRISPMDAAHCIWWFQWIWREVHAKFDRCSRHVYKMSPYTSPPRHPLGSRSSKILLLHQSFIFLPILQPFPHTKFSIWTSSPRCN